MKNPFIVATVILSVCTYVIANSAFLKFQEKSPVEPIGCGPDNEYFRDMELRYKLMQIYHKENDVYVCTKSADPRCTQNLQADIDVLDWMDWMDEETNNHYIDPYGFAHLDIEKSRFRDSAIYYCLEQQFGTSQ